MSATRRPLTVEAFEDRALPSVSYFSFNPWYDNAARYSTPRPSQEFDSGLRASAWREMNETTVYQFRVGHETWVFVWNPYGYGSGQSDGSGGTTTPQQPSTGPVSSPQESAGSVVADAVSTAASAAKATTPKATTTTDNGVQANPAAAPVLSNAPVTTPLAATASTGAAAAAEQAAQVIASQVFIPVAVQQTGTHAAYTFIEGAQTPDGADNPQAPDGTAPKDAPAPAPDAPRPEGFAAAPAPEAAPAATPTAGALPVNLADLRASTANFLGRVSGMAGEWTDGTPTTEDYLWTAAAVLLVGGVVHASRDKQPARPPRGPAGMDSALAEWEGENARRAG